MLLWKLEPLHRTNAVVWDMEHLLWKMIKVMGYGTVIWDIV